MAVGSSHSRSSIGTYDRVGMAGGATPQACGSGGVAGVGRGYFFPPLPVLALPPSFPALDLARDLRRSPEPSFCGPSMGRPSTDFLGAALAPPPSGSKARDSEAEGGLGSPRPPGFAPPPATREVEAEGRLPCAPWEKAAGGPEPAPWESLGGAAARFNI